YFGPNGLTTAQRSTGDRHFVHDTFLAVLLRTGLIGFGLFLVFLLGVVGEGFSRSKRQSDDWQRLIVLTATAALIGGAAISLTADALLRHPFASYYGVLIGLMGNPYLVASLNEHRPAWVGSGTRQATLPVAVSIVSYNTAELLRRCIESVVRTSNGLVAEIVVVDNASSDASADLIAETFREVRVIRNPTNVGFGRAHNQALAATTAPYLLVLNSDASLLPGALEAMVQQLDLQPEIAIVGPKLVFPD